MKALSTRSKSNNNHNNKFVVSANAHKNYHDDEISEAIKRDAQTSTNEKGTGPSTLRSPSKIKLILLHDFLVSPSHL